MISLNQEIKTWSFRMCTDLDWGTEYIHDPQWVGPALLRIEGGIRRDRHHPSVMVWSIGNENMPNKKGRCSCCNELIVRYRDDNGTWWCYCVNKICPKSRFYQGEWNTPMKIW